jgi:hypothetical protein
MHHREFRRVRRSIATLKAGVVVAILLTGAGCGGGSPSPPSGGTNATSPANASTSTARQPAFSPPRTGPLADHLTKSLLTIHDVPGGWRLSQDARGDPEDTDFCGQNLSSIEAHRTKLAEVEVGFERGSDGPFLVHAIAAYPEGTAQATMDRLTAAIASCVEITVRDDEGTASTWQVQPLSFPSLGDQSVAFREFQTVNQVEAVVVYLRRGNLVGIVIGIALRAPVDRVQLESLARLADERLAAR